MNTHDTFFLSPPLLFIFVPLFALSISHPLINDDGDDDDDDDDNDDDDDDDDGDSQGRAPLQGNSQAIDLRQESLLKSSPLFQPPFDLIRIENQKSVNRSYEPTASTTTTTRTTTRQTGSGALRQQHRLVFDSFFLSSSPVSCFVYIPYLFLFSLLSSF